MVPDKLTSPTESEVRSVSRYREHRVPRGTHHLYARDYRVRSRRLSSCTAFPTTSTCTTASCRT